MVYQKFCKDEPTVNSDHSELVDLIDGVTVTPCVTHYDDRGDLTEIVSTNWEGIEPSPHVYMVSVYPKVAKGWVYHKLQSDRLFPVSGYLKGVLYDKRDNSPTKDKLNVLYFSERVRMSIVIPPFVIHAVANVGDHTATFINCPSAPYNYADPDKYRLPIGSTDIPYSFEGYSGG